MMKKPRDGRADLVSDALRQLWASAESDPVPDDFFALLDQLDEARAGDTEPAGGPKPPEARPAGDEPAA